VKKSGTRSFYAIHSHGLVRVAACTPAVAVGDPGFNAAQTLALAREGHARGCDLMLFPELGLSAYAIDDLFLQDALLRRVEAEIAGLAAASKDLAPVLLVGAPVEHCGALNNSAVVIARGKILGVTPKSFLPNYREFYENRWFAPGAGVIGLTTRLAGQEVPFGTDLVFEAADLADFSFAAEICEDVWSPAPPSTRAALAGALIADEDSVYDPRSFNVRLLLGLRGTNSEVCL
jgi:NAD+ synthase (glutamine-hydrolysing)